MRRLKFRALSFTENVVAERRDVVGSHACGSMGDEVRRRVRRWKGHNVTCAFFWTPRPRRSPTPANSCESENDSTGFCKCSPPPEPSCTLSSAQTRGRPASICHCCQSLELMRNMSFPEPCHLDTHTTLRVTQVSYCPPLRQSRMWSAAMRADRSMGDEV